VASSDGLHVREEPNKDSKSLRVDRFGAEVIVKKVSLEKEWAELMNGGGFMASGFLGDCVEIARQFEEKKKAEEEAARKKAEEEEAAKKLAEEEEAAKKLAEEEAAKKLAEEEAAKKLAEEDAAKKLAEEEAAKKLAEEEEAAKKLAEEEAAKKADADVAEAQETPSDQEAKEETIVPAEKAESEDTVSGEEAKEETTAPTTRRPVEGEVCGSGAGKCQKKCARSSKVQGLRGSDKCKGFRVSCCRSSGSESGGANGFEAGIQAPRQVAPSQETAAPSEPTQEEQPKTQRPVEGEVCGSGAGKWQKTCARSSKVQGLRGLDKCKGFRVSCCRSSGSESGGANGLDHTNGQHPPSHQTPEPS
jgi:hypothetical protein